jgi:hypothetical protein
MNIFPSWYVEELERDVATDFDSKYVVGDYKYPTKHDLRVEHGNIPEDFLDRCDPYDDFDVAKKLYESLFDLRNNLMLASQARLWTSLAHRQLSPFMRIRHRVVADDTIDRKVEFVQEHWFLKSSTQSALMRHPIAGLWWGVHLSNMIGEGWPDQFALTKIFFRQRDFRTRTAGTSSILSCKSTLVGLLEFIRRNPSLFDHYFEARARFITRYINKLGGVKVLSMLSHEDIVRELDKVADQVSMIKA